jgi:hypothetical protein
LEDANARENLRQRIEGLLDKLVASLGPGEELTALSSLAAGADTVFAQVAARRGLTHQVFLPAPPDGFFTATDFFGSEDRVVRAKGFLAAPNVVEVRIASDSPDRRMRFSDCGYRIVHESNVLIAVLPPDEKAAATAKPGGTLETLRHAEAVGIPAYRIILEEGMPVLTAVPRSAAPETGAGLGPWRLRLTGDAAPDPYDYIRGLKATASAKARRHKTFFHYAAAIVLLTHLTATSVAVYALALADKSDVASWAKASFLTAGLLIYFFLHHRRPQRDWVNARLVAELCRSALAVQYLPWNLGYLRDFYMPGCRELIHSLSLLHLKACRGKVTDVEAFADAYLKDRVGSEDDPNSPSQIAHYAIRCREARRMRRWLNAIFYAFTFVAIGGAVAAGVRGHDFIASEKAGDVAKLGYLFVPIMFPIIAAAAASWVSVLDLDRRIELYRSMIDFLKHQARNIAMARSNQTILVRVIQRTEHSLLQEVVEWHAKHTHIRGH